MIDTNNMFLIISGSFAASFSAGVLADLIIYGIWKAFGFLKDIIK